MQTSSNIEIRIGQLLKRFGTKCRFDFPIVRKPALDEVRLSFNRVKPTAGLKYVFFIELLLLVLVLVLDIRTRSAGLSPMASQTAERFFEL
jgi:hypothetical protein